MEPWIAGGACFAAGFFLHAAALRRGTPKHQIKVLFGIFLGVLVFFASGWFLGGVARGGRPEITLTAAAVLRFLLFYGALVFSYALTYSAVQADSPSLVIVLEVVRAGAEGLSLERLRDIFVDEKLILPRLRDLVNEGLVRYDGRLYRLTPQGKNFVSPFVLMRAFFGAGKGG